MSIPLIQNRFVILATIRREIAGYPAQRFVLIDQRPKGRLHWTASPGAKSRLEQPTNPFWKD
jgi:hypothetical protein